ncbi:MAG: recombinase family protein [Abitibacteriaceae bacterium]|nr:recombinase family protein [Abditibacteriaceae bacterium]
MRYIFYARKSESDEGRQEKSIEQQREIMLDDARRLDLPVVKRIEEAGSAKVPGKRPGYQEMVQWLRRGKADAILVYHENRLARNPLESGEIHQLLQDGTIKEIRTHESVYRPEDNALLFAVVSSMANQYSRDLSTVVRRGMKDRRDRGWFPHRAPQGYLNDRNSGTITVDTERFPLLRQAWEMMLTDCYSIRDILNRLNAEWGYRTRLCEKSGGGPLSRSALYGIFTNVFYTGKFEETGTLYQGQHPPMVSVHEFQRVQEILGRVGKRQRNVHTFAYTGLIRCKLCQHSITAELHKGRLQRGRYVYYRCANPDCDHARITEAELEKKIDNLLHHITITQEVKELALQEIRSWQKSESDSQESIFEQQQKALLEAERKKNKLVEMYLNDLFESDEDYKTRKSDLQREINEMKLAVEAAQGQFERTRETAENAFKFAATARERFLLGEVNTRRETARALGISYTYAKGEVDIELHPALAAVCKVRSLFQADQHQVKSEFKTGEKMAKNRAIKTLKIGSGSYKRANFGTPVLSGRPNRTFFETFSLVETRFPLMSWMPEAAEYALV